MKDNKKQLIVVIALALVIVSVGVFQFVIGNSPATVARASTKKDDKKTQADVAPVEALKNPMFAVNLPARDPFEPGTLPPDPSKISQPAQAPQPTPRRDPQPEVMPPVMPHPLSGSLGGPLGVEAQPEAKFSFIVSGVMLGAKPMAVFTDAQGGQRLVMLGGSLDPDSTVVSIEKDAVTVRFHGKTLRLTVEGNPNAK